MFNLGFSEILIIGVLALILIGPKQLPDVARVLGRMMKEFKQATKDLSGGLLDIKEELKKPVADSIAAIADIETTLGTASVTLADGRRIEGSLLIAGIGALPVVELATAAGLAIDNGIAVDAQLRTADPSIFAAGDCCSFPLAVYGARRVRLEAWRSAQQLGTLAARNMLGHGDVHDAVPWFWSDQYDLGLQIAGLPDEGRQVVRRDLGAGAFILFHLADDGRLVAASGIGIGTAVARDIRLAEMLIGRGARPDASLLATADVKLKSLLADTTQ